MVNQQSTPLQFYLSASINTVVSYVRTAIGLVHGFAVTLRKHCINN